MIGLGLSLWRQGGGQNPADWPNLALWLKASETSGNTLADSSASPLANGLTRVDTGTHSPWVTSGFEIAAGFNPTNFSQAKAPRNEIDKLAVLGTKAVLMEFYGRIETYGSDATRYLFSVGDFSDPNTLGYAMRVASSSGNHTVNVCAGGATADSLNNAGGTQLLFTSGTTVHLVVFFAGGASNVAGGAVNGTLVYKNISGTPGLINLSSTVTTARQALLGGFAPIPNNAAYTCPATVDEFRVWTFDALPADLDTIVSQMAATPNSLPAALRSPIAGSPDSGYPIGAAFS